MTKSLGRGRLLLVLAAACSSPGSGAGKTAATAEGRRVVLEVFNAAGQLGMARAATVRIRQQSGLDVVFFGNPRDTALSHLERNRIYVRRGDTTGVGRVMAAIGPADVIDQADPTRLVDLSVFAGKNFLSQGPPK